MSINEPLNFMPLDLDTFSGSERFMAGTRLGAAFSQGIRAYLRASYGDAIEHFKAALIAAYVEGEEQAQIFDRERRPCSASPAPRSAITNAGQLPISINIQDFKDYREDLDGGQTKSVPADNLTGVDPNNNNIHWKARLRDLRGVVIFQGHAGHIDVTKCG